MENLRRGPTSLTRNGNNQMIVPLVPTLTEVTIEHDWRGDGRRRAGGPSR